ncbi:MAG: hypothetical protein VX640_05765 [Pseudomonadota bacterium]|nr:hypothetical protein [Pseudomonadota bacterium]
MSNGYGFGGEEIKQESSWRYPLGIFIATLVLCAIFLYYYVGPSVDEFSGNVPSPAISEEPVKFTVGGVGFEVPTNYTVYPRDRRGGERDEVSLYALWPTLAGYTPARREDFVENVDDTRRVDIMISQRTSAFSEQERIDVLYLPQTNDRRGARTSFQLVKYTFQDQRANVPTNGYAGTELYLGETENGAALAIFCFSEREDVKSPECWREYELTPTVSVSYRFKRPYLAEWKAIDARVRGFVEGLVKN